MAEVRIKLKKKFSNDGTEYYIGNCDLELNLADTVIMVYPNDDDKGATLIVRVYNEDMRKTAGHDPEND